MNCVVYLPVPSSSTEVLSLALLQWLRMSDVSSSSLAAASPFTPFLAPGDGKDKIRKTAEQKDLYLEEDGWKLYTLIL